MKMNLSVVTIGVFAMLSGCESRPPQREPQQLGDIGSKSVSHVKEVDSGEEPEKKFASCWMVQEDYLIRSFNRVGGRRPLTLKLVGLSKKSGTSLILKDRGFRYDSDDGEKFDQRFAEVKQALVEKAHSDCEILKNEMVISEREFK